MKNNIEIENKNYEYLSNEQEYSKLKDTINTKILLILANTYGMLKYTDEINEVLSKNQNTIYWIFNLSGQGKTDGVAHIDAYTNDLSNIIEHINDVTNEKKLTILAHCSSFYPVLELSEISTIKEKIEKIIVYNYLHEPNRLLAQAKVKMCRYNVRYKEDIISSDYNPISSIAKLEIPTFIIHPQIESNKIRATDDELNLVKSSNKYITVTKPKNGYDILNTSQKDKIVSAFKNNITPIL